jgi:hypothetical protein
MTNERDDAMSRLNRLGETEPEPIVIVPATPDPQLDEPPATMAMPVDATDARIPTIQQPTVAPAGRRVVVDPVPLDVPPDLPPEFPTRPAVWQVILTGLVALAVGGIVGFLIGDASDVDTTFSSASTVAPSGPVGSDAGTVDQAVVDQRVDDILTLLVAQAQQNGSVVIPTPFPKLDQLLALAAADSPAATDANASPTSQGQGDSQSTIDDLTAERDQLAAQVATLKDQVASVEAERDALQATIDSSGNKGSDQAARISELEGQLKTATDNLAKTQADLDSANSTLDDLNVQQLGNLVGTDVAAVRQTAETNGWQLIETIADTNSGTPNRVTAQQPAAGANMITGSVLYVEVAKPK